MQSKDRSSVKCEQQNSSLEISDVRLEDAGSYTLFVRNRRGSTQHTIQLSVVGEALLPSFLGMALDKSLKHGASMDLSNPSSDDLSCSSLTCKLFTYKVALSGKWIWWLFAVCSVNDPYCFPYRVSVYLHSSQSVSVQTDPILQPPAPSCPS